MLSSDGFWNLASNIILVVFLIYIIKNHAFRVKDIFKEKNFSVKIAGQELSIQDSTNKLGDYVTELQARVANIESRMNRETSEDLMEEVNFVSRGNTSILWVDDFPSNNAFIVENLQKKGIYVDISLKTDDALTRFTALDYRMVISDLGRIEDGVDNPLAGLDLIRSIRRINSTAPIVIFAGRRGVEMKSLLIKEGATEVTSSGIDVMKYVERYMA